jgi:protease I
MAKRKSQRQVLLLVGDEYEDLELWYPRLRLEEAGYQVVMAGLDRYTEYLGKHGYPAESDASIGALEAKDFLGLVIPGGWMPDKLRRDRSTLQLVRDFHAQAKPIAAICHGGWIPISAGIYRGAKVTGSAGIKDDLINAGATYEDAPVVVDRHLISSRRPSDLPAFMRAILEQLEAVKS